MTDTYNIAAKPPLDALGYLQSVYRDATQPASIRMKAAIEALQFERPKLSAVANLNPGGMEFGTELELRRARRDGKLIENQPQVGQVDSGQVVPTAKSAEQVSAEHMNRSPFSRRRL